MRVVDGVIKSVPMRDRTLSPYARMPLAVASFDLNRTIAYCKDTKHYQECDSDNLAGRLG